MISFGYSIKRQVVIDIGFLLFVMLLSNISLEMTLLVLCTNRERWVLCVCVCDEGRK